MRISRFYRGVLAVVFGCFAFGSSASSSDGIWIDGSVVKFQFQPYLESNPEIGKKIEPLLKRLLGVEVTHGGPTTSLYTHFDDDFEVAVANYEQTPNWGIYEVDVPKITRWIVYGRDGVLHVMQSPAHEQWKLKAKMPMMPQMGETLDVNHLKVDFNQSVIYLEAGVFGNFVKVVAQAKINGNRVSKINIDLLESLRKNLGIGDDI